MDGIWHADPVPELRHGEIFASQLIARRARPERSENIGSGLQSRRQVLRHIRSRQHCVQRRVLYRGCVLAA